MNKLLEFRAYHKKNEVIYPVVALEEDHVLLFLHQTPTGIKNMQRCKPEEIELMQFTGYVGLENRKIFEGDIINRPGSTISEKVVYDKGCFWLNEVSTTNSIPLYKVEASLSQAGVIGNIYSFRFASLV